MTSGIKKYSMDYIFGDPKDAPKIEKRLKKGYLERRSITALIDKVRIYKPVTVDINSSGTLTWTVGKKPVDLTRKSSCLPFFIRNIIHALRCFFSADYEDEFSKKVDLIIGAHRSLGKRIEKITKNQLIEDKKAALALTQEAYNQAQSADKLTKKSIKLGKVLALLKEVHNNDAKDKVNLAKVEKNLFKNPHGQLATAKNRIRWIGKLETKIKDLSEKIFQISPTDLTVQKKAFEEAQAELDTLTNEILPSHSQQFVQFYQNIAKFPASDLENIKLKQNVKNHPLFNAKQRWLSVLNKDEFYEMTLCSCLKGIAFLLTESLEKAQKYYDNWKNALDAVATLWKESGSEEHGIDDITSEPFDKQLQVYNSLSAILTIAGKAGLQFKDLVDQFQPLKMPSENHLGLKVPEDEGMELLDIYFEDPSKSNLASLFDVKSPVHSWPSNCQFILAAAILCAKKELSDFEQNPDGALSWINKTLNKPVPPYISLLVTCGTADNFISKKAFNTALSSIDCTDKDREIDLLQKRREKSPDLAKAIDFAKTKKRQAFDQKYRALRTLISNDIMQSLVAKHTTDPEEIGKEGKEFNLQPIVAAVFSYWTEFSAYLQCTKDYLDELKKERQSELALKKHKASTASTKAFVEALKLLQILSSIPSKNKNSLLELFDKTILPSLQGEPYLDLRNDPFHPWLQAKVLTPINKLF